MTTVQRARAAQRPTGADRTNGRLGFVLDVVLSPALYGYMQGGLNAVRPRQGALGAGGPEPPAAAPA